MKRQPVTMAVDPNHEPPEPEPKVPKQTESTRFGNPKHDARKARVSEYLAERAKAAAAESDGNEYEQREAAQKAAAQAAANLSNPDSAPSLSEVTKQLTPEEEAAGLRAELKWAREQLAQQAGELSDSQKAAIQHVIEQQSTLPDPTTVSDDFYIKNVGKYREQLGIRGRRW